MYFNLFNSQYNNICNPQENQGSFPIQVISLNYPITPWDTIVSTMLSGEWRIIKENINLNDKYNTNVSIIINNKTKSVITYIMKYNIIPRINNICHLPIFINTLPTTNIDNYYIGNSTGYKWLSLCNKVYKDYFNGGNNVIAYFRGQQIHWMHFKIKDKNEFYNIFRCIQFKYFNDVVLPLLNFIDDNSDEMDFNIPTNHHIGDFKTKKIKI